MRVGRRTGVALTAFVVAAAALIVTAAIGTVVQVVVLAALLVLGACVALVWVVTVVERRVVQAVRTATPTVREDVRRIEVVQPEAHLEQLVRTMHAGTARLEAGQDRILERLEALERAGSTEGGRADDRRGRGAGQGER